MNIIILSGFNMPKDDKDITDINSLPDTTLEKTIGGFLDVKGKAALATAQKGMHGLFKPALDASKLHQLLQYVVQGNQEKAQAILVKSPELLTQRAEVTDYSGRRFPSISAWEYILWALDTRYMGQMMLACIPTGEKGDAIRAGLLKQYRDMQGGGRDLVKIGGAIDPRKIGFSDLKVLFGNENAILFWNRNYYYANTADPSVTLITPTLSDENRAAFAALNASLLSMEAKSARKSSNEEYALIASALRPLSRKGIRYEREIDNKYMVKMGGAVDPREQPFADIAARFDNQDALLFWNENFYYADKATSSVRLLSPTYPMTKKNTVVFNALTTSLLTMAPHSARKSTDVEHRCINAVFKCRLARQRIHYCESHYDFGVIDALGTCVNRYEALAAGGNWATIDALWLKVGQAQRLLPAHVAQHYCDPDRAFDQKFDFKADSFKRSLLFYDYVSSAWRYLFPLSLNSGVGFQFSLGRDVLWWGRGYVYGAGRPAGWGGGAAGARLGRALTDLTALRGLCNVRMDDATGLEHSLVIAPAARAGAGGPS